jgi:RHS repeat-associated protein
MKTNRLLTRCFNAFLAWAFFFGGIPIEYLPTTSRAQATGAIAPPNVPPTCSGQTTPAPVFLFNGEKNFDELLANFAEPFAPFRLSVQYFSQCDSVGLFGQNWFLNWQKSAVLEGGVVGNRTITITSPGARQVTFEETAVTNFFISEDGWNTTAMIVSNTTIEHQLSCGSVETYAITPGNLTTYTDPGGNSIQFSYNLQGMLSSIVDCLGRQITFGYTNLLDGYTLVPGWGNCVGGPMCPLYFPCIPGQGQPCLIYVRVPTNATVISSITDWSGRTWGFQYPWANYTRLGSITYPPTPDAPTGHVKNFSYDGFLLTKVAWDNLSPYEVINYGGAQVVTNEVSAVGICSNETDFAYDRTEGDTTTVTYPDGRQEIYSYDTEDNPSSYSQVLQYDGTFCPESNWITVTNTWAYLTNERGQSTNTTSSIGLTTVSSFNQYGQILTNTQRDTNTGLSKTWVYTYDVNNGCGKSLQTVTDPLGNTTTITYEFDQPGTSSRPLPVKITQPAVTNALSRTLATANPTTEISYDSFGRVWQIVDASNRTNTFFYTSGGSRATSVMISGGGSNLMYQMRYDVLDRLTQIITPTGLTNSLAYDAMDRVTNYTSNLSSLPIINALYNQWGKAMAWQATAGGAGGVGGSIQAAYDILGRLTTVTDQLGNTTTITYNNQGKTQSIAQPLNRVNQYQYRSDGVLQQVSNALNNATSYCYDQFGRVRQVQDANGNNYQFTYDAWGRLSQETYADGTSDSYVYDALDHVIGWTSRAGQATTYQYDALGRLTQENRPEGVIWYRYLLTGELAQVGGSHGYHTYKYDSLGHLVADVWESAMSDYGAETIYAYDLQGRRSGIYGPGDLSGWNIGEVRDAAGRLTAITSMNYSNVCFGRTYDGMGRIQQDEWFSNAVVKTYLYDAAGHLTNWVVTGNGWSQNRSLQYDAAGRIVTQAVNSVTSTNVYDAGDQLLSSSGSYSYSATYDAVGNRIAADGRTYTSSNINNYVRLTSPNQILLYDGSGNLTNWNGTAFSHDSQGQLTWSPALTMTNQCYDYRRLRTSQGEMYNENDYVYDINGNLIEHLYYDVIDPEYGEFAQVQQYAYGDGIDDAVLMSSSYDYEIAGYDYPGTPYGGGLYAIIKDHLGSVIAITDSSGNLIETYSYTPFGKTTIQAYGPPGGYPSGSLVGNTLGFTGREMDGNFYYFRNRWYSPELGRFLEPDPIGLQGQDVNLYRYVMNDPVRWFDPFGLLFSDPIKPPPFTLSPYPPAPPPGVPQFPGGPSGPGEGGSGGGGQGPDIGPGNQPGFNVGPLTITPNPSGGFTVGGLPFGPVTYTQAPPLAGGGGTVTLGNGFQFVISIPSNGVAVTVPLCDGCPSVGVNVGPSECEGIVHVSW